MKKKMALLALAMLLLAVASVSAQDGPLNQDWGDPADGGGDCPGCKNCVENKWDQNRYDCEETAYGRTGREHCLTSLFRNSCDAWGSFCECIQIQGSLESGASVDRLAAFGLLPGSADVEEYFRPLGDETGACL